MLQLGLVPVSLMLFRLLFVYFDSIKFLILSSVFLFWIILFYKYFLFSKKTRCVSFLLMSFSCLETSKARSQERTAQGACHEDRWFATIHQESWTPYKVGNIPLYCILWDWFDLFTLLVKSWILSNLYRLNEVVEGPDWCVPRQEELIIAHLFPLWHFHSQQHVLPLDQPVGR